jgi:hypothetical protein
MPYALLHALLHALLAMHLTMLLDAASEEEVKLAHPLLHALLHALLAMHLTMRLPVGSCMRSWRYDINGDGLDGAIRHQRRWNDTTSAGCRRLLTKRRSGINGDRQRFDINGDTSTRHQRRYNINGNTTSTATRLYCTHWYCALATVQYCALATVRTVLCARYCTVLVPWFCRTCHDMQS